MRRLGYRGFTLVEVMIVTVVSGLMFGLVFTFFWEYWQYSEKAQADIDTFTTRLDLSDYIRETVGTASGLMTQNAISDPNANVPDSGGAGNNYWIPIHSVPETKTTSASDQPLLYFRRFSQTGSKSFIFNGLNPYEDEYVMYLSSTGELRIRTLPNPSASGNAIMRSCPAAVATSSCPSDKVLITDVSSIAVRYFSRAGSLIDYTPQLDPDTGQMIAGPDFPFVEVLEYTINISKKAFTQSTNTTQSSTVVRVALRNT